MVSFSTGPPISVDLHAGGSGFWKRPGHALIMSRRMGPVQPMCDIALPSKSLESFDLPILGIEVRTIQRAGHCIGCKPLLSQAVTTQPEPPLPLACLANGARLSHPSVSTGSSCHPHPTYHLSLARLFHINLPYFASSTNNRLYFSLMASFVANKNSTFCISVVL